KAKLVIKRRILGAKELSLWLDASGGTTKRSKYRSSEFSLSDRQIIELAKNYFQIHALLSEGAPAIKRKVTRRKMREFFSQIAPCCVGMEACASAHYWARELKAMGYNVLRCRRLIPSPTLSAARMTLSMQRQFAKRCRAPACALSR